MRKGHIPMYINVCLCLTSCLFTYPSVCYCHLYIPVIYILVSSSYLPTTHTDFLQSPLDDWLQKNVPKALVVRLPTRVGLIVARQEGAKRATGDVIVVLDSHCEVMTNWLPPLLGELLVDYVSNLI